MSRKQFQDNDNGRFDFSTEESFYCLKPSNIIEIYLDNTIIINESLGLSYTDEEETGGHGLARRWSWYIENIQCVKEMLWKVG